MQLSVKELPSTNGVYIFLSGKTPVYIGKSVNIKARVKSHIENTKKDSKERAIIESSDSIKFHITDSEFSALLLESQMIQKFKPKYNVRWRDDKSYLYIKITYKDVYPKVFITRKENDAKAIYFGPFASLYVAEDILKEIRKIFPFCTQKKISKQGCFYAKIKQCNPCPNLIEKETDLNLKNELIKEYKKNIRQVKGVLEGKVDKVINELHKKIKILTKNKDYEQAILYRNKLFRIEGVLMRKHFDANSPDLYNNSEKRLIELKNLLNKYIEIDNLQRIECFDMSTLAFENSTASMVVFTDGLSNKKEYRRFKIRNEKAYSDFDMFNEVIDRRFKQNWEHPQLLIVDGGKPQLRAVKKVLANLKIEIPLIGIAKRPDRIVIGESLLTIRPPRNNQGFQLVSAMRDEAHRFAKKYHTHLRNKKML
jgi:excinuclease ABC subunit C